MSVEGTPRRLAVMVADLAARQPDAEDKVRGPPAKVAIHLGYCADAHVTHSQEHLHDALPSGFHAMCGRAEQGDYMGFRLSAAQDLQRQPRLQVAFGSDGSPSKALEGFCKKNAVAAADVTVEADGKGTEYVWVVVKLRGRAAAEVLTAVTRATSLWLLIMPNLLRTYLWVRPVSCLSLVYSGVHCCAQFTTQPR